VQTFSALHLVYTYSPLVSLLSTRLFTTHFLKNNLLLFVFCFLFDASPSNVSRVRTDSFDFFLPDNLIAQHPLKRREDSRLLVFSRPTSTHLHKSFTDIGGFLGPKDLVVLNNSRVLPARLRGTRPTGGVFEILLLKENARNDWWTMLKPGRRTKIGSTLSFIDRSGRQTEVNAVVLDKNTDGHCRLGFSGTLEIRDDLSRLGEIPLPPYIRRNPGELNPEDEERYQTVYASPTGSVAAPTAGLHFTPEILTKIRHVEVTLHVGLGTFAPVKTTQVEEHEMHEEWYNVSDEAAAEIAKTKAEGGRIIAAGTTSLRVLESAARNSGGIVEAGAANTRIFIHPPYKFRCVDALLTNFHLPRSTLLMLVSAFLRPGETGGIEQILQLYKEAVKQEYRFFSYGDAMLIL
jgi:S-adenosylmethionine:tRNA ribosyltransferase-isomerase